VTLLGLLAAPIALVAAAMAAYLTVLGVAAFVAAPQAPPPGPRTRRFAVLVPAHDEALVIERALLSLRAQLYPPTGVDIFVVADNCTDTTARLARQTGAIVYERNDDLRAKGHALRWLLERVHAHGSYDAYVVVDADSVVAPDFLLRMDDRLAAGAAAIQAYYHVLNADASPTAALRESALASLHYLRPLGRAALGLSSGLKGNGMCFSAQMLDVHGWTSAGLAEDVELHLSLVKHGVRVNFAPEAIVRADMPTTLASARSQNIRWEAGRLAALRDEILPLMGTGLARRDPVLIDAAVEQLIPPLSIVMAASAACALVGIAAGNTFVTGAALLGGAGTGLHVLAGLFAVRAPAKAYKALLGAPAYILWKVALYARATVAPRSQPWIRTERPDASQAGAPRNP
jgi:cellulose synthase/poly-beta-1,6-N-acetylglucosamine synthase-like glycosyltransferase